MINPAAYPANDAGEQEAISLFEHLVNPIYIKTEIKKRDKFPNIDGFVEIVRKEATQEIPMGKLDIQIKKIPPNEIKYSCPVTLVAYSETVTLLPVLLICADTQKKRVFWKHIRKDMPEYKEGQATFTVKFDPDVDAIDETNSYVRRWTEIVTDYQQQRKSFIEIKNQLYDGVRLQSLEESDVKYFQIFIDCVNALFDHDFKILKYLYFPNTWKLGVGVYNSTPKEHSYQIYKIPFGKNAPLIASLSGRNFTEILESQKQNNAKPQESSVILQECGTVQSVWRAGACDNTPADTAKNFVFNFIEAALKKRKLLIAGQCLTTECVFEFLDKHCHTTGLRRADEYSLSDINYGFKIFLPVWYKLAHSCPTGIGSGRVIKGLAFVR